MRKLIPIMFLVSGCALQTVDDGAPDATIQFATPQVPVDVKECVKSRAIREIYGRGIQDGHDAEKAFVAETLTGAFGQYGYTWTVDVHPDRAEIRWMTSIDGPRKPALEQIVRECGAA